jgi:bacterioferritin (cytochrome b1)
MTREAQKQEINIPQLRAKLEREMAMSSETILLARLCLEKDDFQATDKERGDISLQISKAEKMLASILFLLDHLDVPKIDNKLIKTSLSSIYMAKNAIRRIAIDAIKEANDTN